MTFKSLLDFGKFGAHPTPSVDRYHSGPSDYGYYDHGNGHGGWKGKGSGGGGSGAALSALTLLAFLFFINVMQQSLDANNNSTTTTFFLREAARTVLPTGRDDSASGKKLPDNDSYERKYVPIEKTPVGPDRY